MKATKEFSNFIYSFQRGEHERVRLACGLCVSVRVSALCCFLQSLLGEPCLPVFEMESYKIPCCGSEAYLKVHMYVFTILHFDYFLKNEFHIAIWIAHSSFLLIVVFVLAAGLPTGFIVISIVEYGNLLQF